ncbi:MAG: monovalent cation/H(+) antiporter subunit G [Campylobacterota bacterium]|nr:monovalent cation/H(+) antiporter subunit G [Campylobacterota bacterium]
MIIDTLSDICLFFGAIFTLTGAIGLLRLPDFYTRLHAASVTESLAAPLLIIGIMLDTGLTLDSAKLALIIVIMVISNPTITHALCRAAAHGGVTPQMKTNSNEKNQSQTKTELSDKGSK